MSGHPSFGPIAPEEFKALVDAPVGAFAKVARKHDPLWGKTGDGTKPKKWTVTLTRDISAVQVAVVDVVAATEKEARELALKTPADSLSWDTDDYDITAEGKPEIESVDVLGDA
jgi:hypothetical protein